MEKYVNFRSLGDHGEGAFGIVKVASRISDNVEVAIKRISNEKIKSEDAWTSLLLERRIGFIAAQRESSFLVHLEESFVTKSAFYLVSELCSQLSLSALIPEGQTLPDINTKNLLIQMVCGLTSLHSYGVIHRDLKPCNVFVTQSGNAKIEDFGCSQKPTGVFVPFQGTTHYAAPESIQGHADKKSDYYSLGVIGFELTHGYLLRNLPEMNIMRFNEYYSDAMEAEISWKTGLNSVFLDLLSNLLETEVAKRFGEEQTKAHNYFHGVDFNNVTALSLDPPFAAGGDFIGIEAEPFTEETINMPYSPNGDVADLFTADKENFTYDDEKPLNDETVDLSYSPQGDVSESV